MVKKVVEAPAAPAYTYDIVLPYEDLKLATSADGIDSKQKELYLSPEEFMEVFKMPLDSFKKLPMWKRGKLKRDAKIF